MGEQAPERCGHTFRGTQCGLVVGHGGIHLYKSPTVEQAPEPVEHHPAKMSPDQREARFKKSFFAECTVRGWRNLRDVEAAYKAVRASAAIYLGPPTNESELRAALQEIQTKAKTWNATSERGGVFADIERTASKALGQK